VRNLAPRRFFVAHPLRVASLRLRSPPNRQEANMICRELMKEDIECVHPSDTVHTAARKMRDANVGFLPVCDSSMRVIGTLTDRDIVLRVCADGRQLSTLVEDVMTREVVACQPTDDITKAEQLMSKKHKSRMLCIDSHGELVGVISLSDIAQREDRARAGETLRQVSQREARP
jgi:CBS domain-containing protein